MLSKNENLSIRKQARLLSLSRSRYYYNPLITNDSELCNLIKDTYLSSDCRYGYRKITADLRRQKITINSKKTLRLMQEIGIQGLYPKRYINTSFKDKSARIYPYLLKNLEIQHANHVWATDITYIKIGDVFMYFVAIIDLYSRYIIAYDLSHSLNVESSISTLDCALNNCKPKIFNSDQGVQFTSNLFVERLKKAGILISHDGKGRCFDNIRMERLWRTIKQEAVYFYRPNSVSKLELCLTEFVSWYNNHRLHQNLNYKTPKEVYYARK